MATQGKSTYYDTTWSKTIPKDSAAHYVKAYLSSHNNDTSRGTIDLLSSLGVPIPSYNAKNRSEVAEAALLSLNANSSLAQKVLGGIGLGTDAQKTAFRSKLTTPGSGVTAEMRVNDPAAAAAQYAKIDAGTSSPTASLGSSTTRAMPSIQPPSVQLQPGSTDTAAVKQLQDYLVANGYMTQAQVNTGYGTYGPQTTTAVTKMQQALGVDNSSGPGYYGPRTLAAVQQFPRATGGTTTATGPAGKTGPDPDLQQLLNNPNLSGDQKAAIQAIYDAVSTNDADTAERLKSAMAAAKEYSEPYFKAQIRLVTDALDRGLSSEDADAEFNVKKRRDALRELQDDIAASKGQLTFQNRQELEALGRDYVTKLDSSRNDLAATGFTSSTRRQRTEDLLQANYGGAVETSNRGLAYQTGRLDRQETAAATSTAAEIENLRRLASEGKLNLIRKAEEQTGSAVLRDAGYSNLLGDVGGTIPRQQYQDQLSFANSFVF